MTNKPNNNPPCDKCGKELKVGGGGNSPTYYYYCECGMKGKDKSMSNPYKPNNKVEEMIEELVKNFHDNWTEQYDPNDWRRLKGRRAIDCEAWLRKKFFEALTSSYEQGVRDERERITKFVQENHKGTFTDDAGYGCWYIDDLVRALKNN